MILFYKKICQMIIPNPKYIVHYHQSFIFQYYDFFSNNVI
jgi:hypothetical protein